MAATRKSSPHGSADLTVGLALKRLRLRVGITGQELGHRAGMSQAKISKIETGRILPSPEDVERLARHLGASASEIDRLTVQAGQNRDRMMDWRFGRNDAATWQREIALMESAAQEIRSFQPAVITGLLQTGEYAKAVLTTVQETWSESVLGPPAALAEAVSARVNRQKILEDQSKTFHFVIPEPLLRNLVGEPEDMFVQLRRLSEVARQDNVSLLVIPEVEHRPYPPYHGFLLLDDQHVIIDLYNTVVVTRGRSDIRLYRHVFDALESRATPDIVPILEKYRREYLRLATEQ
jgi:transcriptional regulator with XRE-family HTH domain